MTDADPGGDVPVDTDDVRSRLESTVGEALEARDAVAFVHAGSPRSPAVRYCRSGLETDRESQPGLRTDLVAVAFDGTEWQSETWADASARPADAFATRLADRVGTGTVLTPPRIPHDAVAFLENAGFAVASTDALARARARKTTGERERIANAQAAASAGIRRASSVLADATAEEGRLLVDGETLSADRLRREIDGAIVSAGGFPAGYTTVDPPTDSQLRVGEPIVVSVAPREPGGYHGGLARTFVVDGDGGRERRTHVATTQAFRSTQAMLTAGSESVTAVEADLEAEIRAFGEDGPLTIDVAGVGLEPVERPIDGSDEVGPGSVVRIDVTVSVGDASLRIADLLAKDDDGVEWLAAPSRSLSPSALLE